MSKIAVVSFRIEPVLKEALERAAKANRRSLANYLEIVLSDHVAAIGAQAITPSQEE